MSKQLADPGWGMSAQQVEDFYLRWREWMLVADTNGAIIVMNTAHRGFMKDLTDRLAEDTWWTLQRTKTPTMMFHEVVPYDNMMFSVAGRGLLTPQELVGTTGFGRMNAKAPSRDGVRPWSTAEVPDDAKLIQPDSEPLSDEP